MEPADPRLLYLDLIKRMLTRFGFEEPSIPLAFDFHNGRSFARRTLIQGITQVMDELRLEIVKVRPVDPIKRMNGLDYPSAAESMIGIRGMENLQFCMLDVLKNNIPGDFIETGVWRGGSCIFMRAVLKAYGIMDRRVWVADSFQGFPPLEDQRSALDKAHAHHYVGKSFFQLSIEQVKKNFEKYGLLDDQVCFLKGWFKDTLPSAPIRELAVLRLDGDLYDSTMDALNGLYGKLSTGGYLIVDDYDLEPCRVAIHDFREQQRISDEILRVDQSRIYWKKRGA